MSMRVKYVWLHIVLCICVFMCVYRREIAREEEEEKTERN